VTADPDAERPEADGLVTAAAATTVGVVTADCVPVLLLAPRRRGVAAVHAGWRGAAAGIVAAALAHLRDRFDVEPSDVEAALGPAIGPCCYEVGADVRDAFERASGTVTRAAWRPLARGFMLDLRRAVQLLLEHAGVPTSTVLGPCTRCSPAYCSYRRDGAGTGRQVSFIGWA
jgi:YfiH family protein